MVLSAVQTALSHNFRLFSQERFTSAPPIKVRLAENTKIRDKASTLQRC